MQWEANLSIPQIKLSEPKQTIANWASAHKQGEQTAVNKMLVGSLSAWLTAASELCRTETINCCGYQQTGRVYKFCSATKLKKKTAPHARCSQSCKTGSLC